MIECLSAFIRLYNIVRSLSLLSAWMMNGLFFTFFLTQPIGYHITFCRKSYHKIYPDGSNACRCSFEVNLPEAVAKLSENVRGSSHGQCSLDSWYNYIWLLLLVYYFSTDRRSYITLFSLKCVYETRFRSHSLHSRDLAAENVEDARAIQSSQSRA